MSPHRQWGVKFYGSASFFASLLFSSVTCFSEYLSLPCLINHSLCSVVTVQSVLNGENSSRKLNLLFLNFSFTTMFPLGFHPQYTPSQSQLLLRKKNNVLSRHTNRYHVSPFRRPPHASISVDQPHSLSNGRNSSQSVKQASPRFTSRSYPNARLTPNALINETSRYLVESAYDAVRWHPWGPRAFKLAHDSQKPILLSSGFHSCHMCDVMDRHYRDPALADLLNRKFICIKVDREERPDVDSVYNAFVQAVTGRSGWPLTCFLTPRLIPFVGTTYLPPDRLVEAVRSIADRWENSSHLVERDGLKVLTALRNLFVQNASIPSDKLSPNVLRRAFKAADTCFDVKHGGFGSAPKFPRPSVFEFLLSMHLASPRGDRVKTESLDMVLDSLREIAAGGIHDHIGGGFFRYALDAAWHVPHFEKILSDQAQLASSYLNAYLITREASFKDVACKTLDFINMEMRDRNTGVFYSAIHADSPSLYDVERSESEGAFYTFSSFELKLMLGEPASSIFHKRFGVEPGGNVCNEAAAKAEYGGLEGLNVLRISSTIEQIAREMQMSEKEVEEILSRSIRKVRRERNLRPHPRVDDLTITCWNALTISAFARAGAALQRKDYIEAAIRAANAIMEEMVTREDLETDCIYLARAYRGTRGKVEAFAEDYADAIQAYIDCYEVTGKKKYLLFARRLQNTLDVDFWEDGGYCNCKKGESNILIRRKEDYDGAEPSSSSVAALNLVRLASLLGDSTLLEKSKQIAKTFSQVLQASPLAMPTLLIAVQALMTGGSKKVVVVGNNEEAAKMLDEYWSRGLPRSVALVRVTEDGGQENLANYIGEGYKQLWTGSGDVSAFVCDGDVCLEPTHNVNRFSEELEFLREATQMRSIDGI